MLNTRVLQGANQRRFATRNCCILARTLKNTTCLRNTKLVLKCPSNCEDRFKPVLLGQQKVIWSYRSWKLHTRKQMKTKWCAAFNTTSFRAWDKTSSSASGAQLGRRLWVSAMQQDWRLSVQFALISQCNPNFICPPSSERTLSRKAGRECATCPAKPKRSRFFFEGPSLPPRLFVHACAGMAGAHPPCPLHVSSAACGRLRGGKRNARTCSPPRTSEGNIAKILS